MKNSHSLYMVIVMVLAACSPKEPEYISALATSTTAKGLHGPVKEFWEDYESGTKYIIGRLFKYDTSGMLQTELTIHNRNYSIDSEYIYTYRKDQIYNDSLVISSVDSIIYDPEDLRKKRAFLIKKIPDCGFNPYLLKPNRTHYYTDFENLPLPDSTSVYTSKETYLHNYTITNQTILQEDAYYLSDDHADTLHQYTATYHYDALKRLDTITYQCYTNNHIYFDEMGLTVPLLTDGTMVKLCLHYAKQTDAITQIAIYGDGHLQFTRNFIYNRHQTIPETVTKFFFRDTLWEKSIHKVTLATKDSILTTITNENRYNHEGKLKKGEYNVCVYLDYYGNQSAKEIQYLWKGKPQKGKEYDKITYYEE